MDIETISKLLDAGYTKAEIDALAGEPKSEPNGEDAGATTPDAGTESGDANEKNASEIVAPEIAEVVKGLTESVKGLQDTVKAMQDKAAGAAHTDKPGKDTVYDTIKSFTDSL